MESYPVEIPIVCNNINYEYIPASSKYLDYAEQYLIGNYTSTPSIETGRFMSRGISNSREKSNERRKNLGENRNMKEYISKKLLKY
jgi:hypothetical protein